MKTLLAALTALCVSYLAIAFILWELDPSKWSEMSRFTFVWFGVFASIAVGGFTYTEGKQ